MLFYIKRYLSLEIVVTILLGGLGYWGIEWKRLPLELTPAPHVILAGFAGASWLTAWTLLVQTDTRFSKERNMRTN